MRLYRALERTTWRCPDCGWAHSYDEPMSTVYCVACFHAGRGADHVCVRLSRRDMLDALLAREDLLSSRDWPWTTERIREAFDALTAERITDG